jgi:ABC-type branched-subunit amino acid transport system substrate-binding protein
MWHFLRRVGVFLMLPLVCSLGSNIGGLASAATSGPEKTVIRIGALLDQTGGSTTALYRAAVELGARQINEALAKSGSRLAFEIVYGDTKSNPSMAQSEAIRLINQ